MNTTQQFLEAVERGDLEEVQRFIQEGTPLDSKDDCGWTPLHFAARYGRVSVVEYLVSFARERSCSELKVGAPLDAKDDLVGWTPLHTAARNGHLSVVECLVKAGADYLAVTNNGWTAKELAKKKEIIDLLQKWEDGPDVKEPDCL